MVISQSAEEMTLSYAGPELALPISHFLFYSNGLAITDGFADITYTVFAGL